MELPRLDTDFVNAWYDADTQTANIQYKGILDSRATQKLYQWMGAMSTVFSSSIILKNVIFDFRQVTGFDQTNLASARNESKKLTRSFDVSNLPAALIVANDQQATAVALSTKVSGQSGRSRIVYSEAEAKDFFDEWWQTHEPPTEPPNYFP